MIRNEPFRMKTTHIVNLQKASEILFNAAKAQ